MKFQNFGLAMYFLIVFCLNCFCCSLNAGYFIIALLLMAVLFRVERCLDGMH